MSLESKHRPDRTTITLLCGVGIICLCLWLFLKVSDEVRAGDHQPLEEEIIRSLRTSHDVRRLIGPPWMETVARDLSALGGVVVLTMVTTLAAAWLLILKRRRMALFVALSVITGTVLSSLLKSMFARDRPEEALRLMLETSPGFPSGHSMVSSVVYLTLGVLLTQIVETRSQKFFFILTALGLIFLIGTSRVLLGVHYPSDVISGWAAGIAWALLCWFIAGRHLHQPYLAE